MRLFNVFLLAAVAFLAESSALPAVETDEAAKVSTFTFTERPHVGRSLRSEQNGVDVKRFLKKSHLENEEESAVGEPDDDSEERSMWDTLVKKAKLQYWFQRGKKPAWVRAKLGVPATGVNVENHKNYKHFQAYVKNYNSYKYFRFSSWRYWTSTSDSTAGDYFDFLSSVVTNLTTPRSASPTSSFKCSVLARKEGALIRTLRVDPRWSHVRFNSNQDVETGIKQEKPRIQRLLPAPGQSTAQDGHSLRPSVATTLIHLPDSPPRMLSVRSNDSLHGTKEGRCARTMETMPVVASSYCSTLKTEDEARGRAPESNSNSKSVSNNAQLLVAEGNCSSGSDEKNVEEHRSVTSEPENRHWSIESEQGGDRPDCQQYEQDSDAVTGPLLTDIGSETNAHSADPNQGDRQDLSGEDLDDDEYEQALATRQQLLSDEANRQRIREELETYVSSLSSRMDENGEHLVEYPRNYQQVVSLMTQKDVSDEESTSPEGNHTRQSWSRVLIESGLSKQQAFGILEDVDDDPESSSLAAKIALKMARIRQLDTILEEKLGKNLYASVIPRKQKRAQSPPQRDAAKEIPSSRSSTSKSSSRTFVTQPQTNLIVVSNGGSTSRSDTASKQLSVNQDEVVSGVKKSNNFIERNKLVVANGMKANMTKDEEERLEKLLREEATVPGGSAVSDDPATGDTITNDGRSGPKECNEFRMTEAEKQSIEELIATKSSAYPLFAIDELQDGPTDEALPPSDTRAAKDNIIQETKRERLQRQRLSRVEQELRFLQESPSVVIVGDDHDGDGNDDDCRSEKSFVTVASSTCSTRSGVISRHDFKCFLAQQKESYHSIPTASAEEIRRLLLSIGHGSAASSNPMTATTG